MKYFFITLITFYQNVISPLFHQLFGVKSGCRYDQTCSEYAKEVLTKYSVGKGLLLSIHRVINCQPFFSI